MLRPANGLRLDSQVTQLAQAMSNYAPFNPAAASYLPNDPALQAAVAGAWHT
jgi:hypothetical protein